MSVKPAKKLLIKVIHGPNLNLLGLREPDVYGTTTLADINNKLEELAAQKDVTVEFFQSNHEGEIVDCIHAAKDHDGFLINPAAYTHTSVAIRDALLAIAKPFVEVHLSNINKREDFRQHSYFSDIATHVAMGKGADSYYEGFEFLINQLMGE